MKFQRVYKPLEIVEACRIGSLINALEYVVDEYLLDAVDVEYSESTAVIRLHPYEGDEDLLEEIRSRLYGDVWNLELRDYPLHGSREELLLGDGFKSLYYRFRDLVYRGVAPVLRTLAIRTGRTRIEYFGAVAEGELLVVEGSQDRVTLPSLKALATVHTHPPGHCMFSWKDVEAAMDLFSNSGILTGIIAEDCSLLLYRVGMFTIREYEALLSLRDLLRSGRIEDAVRLAGRMGDLRMEGLIWRDRHAQP